MNINETLMALSTYANIYVNIIWLAPPTVTSNSLFIPAQLNNFRTAQINYGRPVIRRFGRCLQYGFTGLSVVRTGAII